MHFLTALTTNKVSNSKGRDGNNPIPKAPMTFPTLVILTFTLDCYSLEVGILWQRFVAISILVISRSMSAVATRTP